MTRATARSDSLGSREVGSLAPAIHTEGQAAAAPSSAVRPDLVEHVRELTEQARVAFEVARDAFFRLETAHQKGRPGIEENATFREKVALFRMAARAVHEAAAPQRQGGRPRVVAAADGPTPASGRRAGRADGHCSTGPFGSG